MTAGLIQGQIRASQLYRISRTDPVDYRESVEDMIWTQKRFSGSDYSILHRKIRHLYLDYVRENHPDCVFHD